jgi:hypothetical protein
MAKHSEGRNLSYGGRRPADYLPAHNRVAQLPGFVRGRRRGVGLPPSRAALVSHRGDREARRD